MKPGHVAGCFGISREDVKPLSSQALSWAAGEGRALGPSPGKANDLQDGEPAHWRGSGCKKADG